MSLAKHISLFFIVFMSLLMVMKAESLYAADKNTGSITIAHKEATPGTVVDVPVTVTGFTNVIVMEIHIMFNRHVLTPDAESKNYVANLYPSIGNAQFDLYNDSTIILTWYNLSGRTIPDGSKLFDLRLPFCMDNMSCASYGSTSPLQFNASKTYLVKTGFVGIPLTLNNGSVYIPVETFELNIDKTGNGSVKVNEALYTGTMFIPEQTTVSLQAFPDEGWQFVTWSGDLLGNENPASLLMDADKQVTANFELKTYTITASPNNPEYGSVSGGGTYSHGEQVSLEATAEPGYLFVNWTEGGTEVSTTPVYFFTATADRELVAQFRVEDTYSVSTSVIPEGSGSTTGDGTFRAGDEVALEATPATGYDFIAWKDTDEQVLSTSALYTFLMPANDVSLAAHFGLKTYTITASPNNPDYGSVSGGGTYSHGEQVSLEAIAATGHLFVNWTEGGVAVSTTPVYSFTATANRELVAQFRAEDTYAVSIRVVPQGSGSTTGDGTFRAGDEVTLAASPAAGYDFVAWKDTDEQVLSTSALYTFLMPASDVSLAAHFELKTYTITASPNNPDYGSVSGGGTYSHGEQVSLEALPAAGYRFVAWIENEQEVSLNQVYAFTAGMDRSLSAVFEPVAYSLQAFASPEQGGNISGAGDYYYGEEVNLQATANEGYAFKAWHDAEDELVSDEAGYAFTMPAHDLSLTAYFELKAYSITTSANNPSFGTVSGEGDYEHGSEVILQASPAAGYSFLYWTEDEQEVSTDPVYVFTATAERSLVAHFERASYTITATAYPSDGGLINGESPYAGVFEYGEVVTLHAVADNGFEFVGWLEGSSYIEGALAEYTFTVVSDRKLIANFDVGSVIIQTAASPADGGSISGGGIYHHGDQVSLIASPATGYNFVRWTEGEQEVSTDPAYVFAATANRSFVANFSLRDYALAAAVVPEGAGTVSGTGTFYAGDVIELEAVASEDYVFVAWKDEAGETFSTDPVYSFSMPAADVSLLAHFSLRSYSITATPEDPSFGTVTGAGTYEHGALVTLEAVPAAGYAFTEWTEGNQTVLSQRVYSFTATGDRELLARFESLSFTLAATVVPEGAGTVSGSGTFFAGDVVELEAVASEGYVFVAWKDEANEMRSTDPVYSLSMPANNLHLTAHFLPQKYTITASANIPDYGIVTGAGTYEHGEEVVLEAIPAGNSHFINWTENETEVGTEPLLQFVATSDRNLTAQFELKTYIISASAGQGGSITPSGEITVTHGDGITFEIEASEGYDIADVWVDGQSVGQFSSYSFENISDNHNIYVEFSLLQYEVSFSVNMSFVTMEYAGYNFDPASHKVYLAGNMFGEWVIPGADPEKQLMTNTNDNEKIYKISLHIEAGTYAYNYFLNEGWGGKEWEGSTKREVVVTGDMEVNDWFGSPTDPTDISDIAASTIVRIYPVPAKGWFIVESTAMIVEVEVWDLLGRQLMRQLVHDNRREFNVSALSTGVYLVRVRTTNGLDTRVIHITN